MMTPETWAAHRALMDNEDEYIPQRPVLTDEQVKALLSSAEAEGLIPASRSASAEMEAAYTAQITSPKTTEKGEMSGGIRQ